MNVNRYKILLNNNDNEVNLLLNSQWEVVGLSDGYSNYEKTIIKKVVNPETDFEVDRFSHQLYFEDLQFKTNINYHVWFYNSQQQQYFDSYINSDLFSVNEVYYNSNSFSKSFFKLDLYDFSGTSEQKNYITIIIPTQQGFTESQLLGSNTVSVRRPKFSLDFLGDKEGFFIYWLKQRDYLNITTFYMSAKFFDAKNGRFIRLINSEQPASFNFNPELYYYYKVELNYDDKTYQIFDTWTQNRVGTTTNPIKWYEYVNP